MLAGPPVDHPCPCSAAPSVPAVHTLPPIISTAQQPPINLQPVHVSSVQFRPSSQFTCPRPSCCPCRSAALHRRFSSMPLPGLISLWPAVVSHQEQLRQRWCATFIPLRCYPPAIAGSPGSHPQENTPTAARPPTLPTFHPPHPSSAVQPQSKFKLARPGRERAVVKDKWDKWDKWDKHVYKSGRVWSF